MNGVIDFATLSTEHKGKPDASQRTNVEFKPAKKMKKRRQLDALVGNGKLPRRKHSGHELLRSNDSDSSEVEEFRVLEGHRLGKRWSGTSCCNTCSVLMFFIILATCLVASASLIWMHLELKRDFSSLQERLALVENKNAGTPDELQLFHSKLLAFNKSVQDLSTGKYGLIALNKSIEDMKKQIESLTASNTQLKNQASDHDGLAAESHSIEASGLEKTVADIGSEVSRMKTDMEQLKSAKDATSKQIDDLNKRLLKAENVIGKEGVLTTMSDVTQNLISQLNTTLMQNFEQVMARYSSLEAHVDVIDKVATNLQEQLKNLTAAVQNISQSLHSITPSNQQQSQEGSSQEGGENSQLAARVMNVEKHLVSLDEVISQFKNGTAVNSNNVEGMQNESSILSELKRDHQDFLVFRTEAFQDIDTLNASLTALNISVKILNLELNDLTSRLENSMQQMTNVSSSMEQVVTFLEKSRGEHDDKSKTDANDPSGRMKNILEDDKRKFEENPSQAGSELTTPPSDDKNKQTKEESEQQ
ncbi:EF-hand calcium-binding domain-containing protein 14-like isoform X1 [Pomacea canaliculata]|uniref:EF-hand calcium-binding domain-containing protein 14-like isoform X1 n=1 Tax=Pomacea canaliculata TaxID=400727 RepID=UPI000D737EF5|nr:EF-hand calcium-binding domain-containing protein 14-like isoform X1 [Pomacea canaliculata]XP_025109477.1 EF-hand calcium-binding domain-containing protein 14-like isoform X1 [Pomacea canaliculata]